MATSLRASILLTLLSASLLSFTASAQDPKPEAVPQQPAAKTDEDIDPSMAPVEIKDVAPAKPLTPDQQAIADEAAAEVEAPEGPKNFEDYNRPLLFTPEDNKIEITSPQVRWDLTNDKINLGGLNFDSSSIRIVVDQLLRSDVPSRFREGGRNETKVTNVSFVWPSFMTRTGRLMIQNLQGKILWSTNIDETEREKWVDSLAYDTEGQLKNHRKSFWGVTDADPEQWAFMKNATPIRFCFSNQNEEEARIRFCSQTYKFSRVGETIKLLPQEENKTATVSIGKTDLGARARVNFPPGKKIVLKIQFKNGAYAQISSRPLAIRFLDIVESKDTQKIILTGEGAKPLGPVKDVEVPPNHFWSATGSKKETIWQMEVSRGLPIVRVLGAWNVPFTYVIKYQALPKESDRVYIHKRTGSGTYVNGARIKAYVPSGANVSSKEQKTKQIGPNLHEWKFQARSAGGNNYSRLSVTEPGADGKTWVAHYDLFRGFSYEFSARLTGIVDQRLQTAIIGELAASKWFETAFGIDSPIASNRRWGMSVRYFRAISPFAFTTTGETSPFTVLNGELRYNLLPGIWNRDELFGLIAGGQQVTLNNATEQFVGGGAYWARTMPKIFDDLFNLVPIMRYPKYVDVEFIYYPKALKEGTESGMTFNLNFHGKVFWSKRIYGEAGFGIKQYDYESIASDTSVKISTAYGTVGLGIVF